MNHADSTVNRRGVLKSAGAFAGGNVLGVEWPDEPTARTRLVELGYEYSLDSPSVAVSSLPISHFDFAPHYRTNTQGDVLVNPYADLPNEIPAIFGNRGFVVRGREYSGPDEPKFARRTDILAWHLASDFRRTYELRLEEPIGQPDFTVSCDGVDAVVEGDDVDLRVGPTEEVRQSLAPFDVEVELTEVIAERIDVDSVPERRRPLRTERRVEQVTVTPELRIRNNGRVSVYEGTPV